MKIVIEVTEDGRVGVNGPLGNKVLMYGILEAARDAVFNYDASKVQLAMPTTKLIGEK